jgi:hypothetical protein
MNLGSRLWTRYGGERHDKNIPVRRKHRQHDVFRGQDYLGQAVSERG